jgi:indole-3-glycerol phosphate synthase
MNILDAIVEHKRIEVLKRKQGRPLSDLAGFPHYRKKNRITELPGHEGKPGIIAEFKRKSPSGGSIHPDADPVSVAAGYRAAGAVAMSILTDRDFFGGSLRDLAAVRDAQPDLPLLRKDFIIDPYQLHEASAYGADMVLLIAAILEKHDVAALVAEAGTLGLEVLLEVHSEEELEKFHPGIRYVGINNRDLKTFSVDMARGMELIGKLPGGVVAVAESGIRTGGDIRQLWEAGFNLFLIGETFMRQADPGLACKRLIEEVG